MKSLVAAMLALAAVFAFTSTTAASAGSQEDELRQSAEEWLRAYVQRLEYCEERFADLYEYDRDRAVEYIDTCVDYWDSERDMREAEALRNETD